MRLSQRVLLVCAVLMMPVSSAFAQLRLSGSGRLDEVQSPFTAFNVGAVQFEFLLPQPPNGEALPPAAFLLVGITGRFSREARSFRYWAICSSTRASSTVASSSSRRQDLHCSTPPEHSCLREA